MEIELCELRVLIIKQSKRVIDFLVSNLQRSGLKYTANRAMQLYRREGLAGVFRLMATTGQTNPVPGSGKYDRNDYDEWIRRYDTLTDETRVTMRTRIDAFSRRPLISILMPTYNPQPRWLIEAIESVRNQIYPDWELCAADDASTDAGVRELLQRYADNDSRIKVVFRKINGHISAASNSALELAKGEYIALLDNDDLLPEQALFWVADAIVTNPSAEVIYSDEDKIDQSGRRYDPYFKPDWNPDLFLSQNMVSHLGVYRTDLVRDLGGFREGYEGSQDYDLALRCIEKIAPQQIVHIPRVLYHWRSHPGSTAQAGSEKSYALSAGARALSDHLSRTDVSAKVELLNFGMYRVRYTIPSPAPMVSLIIPKRNDLNLIKQCVESILAKTIYKNYEIVIVDTNPDDADSSTYFARLSENKRIQVIHLKTPFNFSASNNVAIHQARGEYIGLIGDDIEVISPEWLDEMISLAIQPGVGAVGARLWYPNDTLEHGGCITGIQGVVGHSHRYLPRGSFGYFARAQVIQTLSVVTAACLVIKKRIYQEAGGLDETNLKVAFTDVDFCLRVREAGFRNVWTPYAELYHHESGMRKSDDAGKMELHLKNDMLYMQKRWGTLIFKDPAYSPNLTLDREDFSYAWPPRIDPFDKSSFMCDLIFNEAEYLAANPDVAAAVNKRKFRSGLDHYEMYGKKEGRRLFVRNLPEEKVLSREDKVFYLLDKKGLGLEIGPSFSPIAPKIKGFNVHVLDHTSAAELRKKYKEHGVSADDLDNIEEVDFVWRGEPYNELIGKTGCYDWIIASHVIEHAPDLISFLQQCEALLKPTGILSLVIPDKRYCFDYFSSSSSTGNVLDAHAETRVRPSHGQIFDHFANAAKRNGNGAWSSDGMGGADELFHTFSEAAESWEKSNSTTDYTDVHCWRFTPASFRLMVSDLLNLGLIDLEIRAEFDTVGCEFYVSLGKKSNTPKQLVRLAALQARKLENA